MFLGRLNTPYYRDNPFVEERVCYLAHPFERGCLRGTMIGTGKVGWLGPTREHYRRRLCE